MTNIWVIATEQLRQSVKSWLLVALAVVGLGLVLIFNSCWVTLFVGGEMFIDSEIERIEELGTASQEEIDEYIGEFKEQRDEQSLYLARSLTFHVAAFWGIIIAIMLGMNALVGPLNNGRAAIILSKAVRRWELVLGQILGATMSAASIAFLLAFVNWVIYCLTIGVFDGKLWIGMGISIIAYLLTVSITAAITLFVPRIVAVIVSLVIYVLSYATAFEDTVRMMLDQYIPNVDLSTIDGIDFYTIILVAIDAGTDIFFLITPPIGDILIRAQDIIDKMPLKEVDWWAFAQAGIFIVVALTASWLLIYRKDI